MVKVNLEYNPYVLQIGAKFNGKEPHINSLVEKYENIPLHKWIKEIPDMLYDEMNGYDFDLEFIGPDLEYEDIVDSFRNSGISSDEVRCIQTLSVESRNDKLDRIKRFNDWLDNNPNRRLDLEAFKMENQDIFDNSHSIIIIGGADLGEFEFKNANVSMEIISNIKEMENTDLKDIPIIIDADRMSTKELQDTLIQIIHDNSDVINEQLFIFVRNSSKSDIYTKLIDDNGFRKSHVINNIHSSELKKYFEYYPLSEYIRNYLKILRKKVNELKAVLDIEKEESEKANGEVMSQIIMIENHITIIKESIVLLENINKTIIIPDWDYMIDEVFEMINTWKIKKTQFTSDEESVSSATQFEEDLKNQWSKFIEKATEITIDKKNKITVQCIEIYDKATKSHTQNNPCGTNFDDYMRKFDGLRQELLKINQQTYEKPKEGIINGIFKDIKNDKRNGVLVTTYSCQKWREYVKQFVEPIIGRFIRERNSEIQLHCSETSMLYLEKLNKLLIEREEDKENFSKRLSDDIRKLQNDCDWLERLNDNLETIERS